MKRQLKLPSPVSDLQVRISNFLRPFMNQNTRAINSFKVNLGFEAHCSNCVFNRVCGSETKDFEGVGKKLGIQRVPI